MPTKMPNCSTCKDSLRPTDKIACTRSGCNRAFHYMCVGMTKSNKKLLSWTCPNCSLKKSKEDSSKSPIPSGDPEAPDTESRSNVTTRKPNSASELRESPLASPVEFLQSTDGRLRSLIQEAIKNEISGLKSQITSIETSLNYISGQYDSLLKTLQSTTTEVRKLKEENVRLRTDLVANTVRIQHLEEENARQQQWSRLQNIELVGVPETKNEDTADVVVNLAKNLGLELHSSELEFAHRVQPRRPGSASGGRTIIARFRHRRTKDTIVAAARKRHGIKPSDMGLGDRVSDERNIYVNEHLTKNNRALLKECKQKAKTANFKFVWTKNCLIYARRDESSPPIPIVTSADLIKIG